MSLARMRMKSTTPHATNAIHSSSAMQVDAPTIIYTETDEAPNLATYSFLPVVKKNGWCSRY
jgi:hypothetical protein